MNRVVEVRWLGRVPYGAGLALQQTRVEQRRSGEIPDQLLLLEHPHVITLGSSAQQDHVLADERLRAEMGIELFEAGRGGDVTYHGPGQLVGYPILDLKPDRKDLHRYLRDLEEVLRRAVQSLGVDGSTQRDGLTGLWVPQGKLAAIGVRVSSGWITSHGFALNVHPDLKYFDSIVPCGIQDESVTSLTDVLGREVTMEETRRVVVDAFAEVFDRSPVHVDRPS